LRLLFAEGVMDKLFAYGTLMCGDIFHAVTGRRLPAVSATLMNYQRLRVRGEHYPAIRVQPGGQVEGILYRQVSRQLWRRLDQFEGSLYRRCSIVVRLAGGHTVTAYTYVIRPRSAQRLLPLEWDFDTFLEQGKAHFLQHYRGFSNVAAGRL
jgi:gamma-glutamylcyclotransferase (GGCT)/AIG2-like uncharacterized protein YtfP